MHGHTRRELLATSLLIAAPATIANPAPLAPAALLEPGPELERLRSGGPREHEAYLHQLAARALSIGHFPQPEKYIAMRRNPGVEVGPAGKSSAVILVYYRLAPETVMPTHNHPNYSVISLGLEGETVVEHFEPHGESPPHEDERPFVLIKTAERLLRAGELSTLTPRRDNLHRFRAGARGARWIDITTRHANDVGFRYVAGESGALASGDRLRGHWVR
jgi:hypothetical protein